jgi:hypothetical protein
MPAGRGNPSSHGGSNPHGQMKSTENELPEKKFTLTN